MVVLVASGVVAVAVTASATVKGTTRDLPKSTPGNPSVTPLAAATTYGASLIDPTPNLTPAVSGWAGAQFDSHQGGKVRFENATLFWKDARHEFDVISGPAMTLSPADTLAKPLSRNFNFATYDPPTLVRWTSARRLSHDATAPPRKSGSSGCQPARAWIGTTTRSDGDLRTRQNGVVTSSHPPGLKHFLP
jgi:hypothetical protein